MTPLEIIITNGWLTLIIVGLVLVTILVYNVLKTKAELIAQKRAADLFEKFRQTEVNEIRKSSEEQSKKMASVLLQEWKIEHEAKIREDAINRSYSVNLGKISEHLLPFHIKFPYNPHDARFIGSPIDMILFDGHSEKRDEITVHFLEIKTGKSRLTEGQKKIKNAILNKRVEWREINPAMLNLEKVIDDLRIPVPEAGKSDIPTIDEDIATLRRTTETLISDGADNFKDLLNSLKNDPAYKRLCKNKNFNIADFEKQLSEIFED